MLTIVPTKKLIDILAGYINRSGERKILIRLNNITINTMLQRKQRKQVRKMTKRQKLINSYNEALDKMTAEGHCMVQIGHDYIRNGKRREAVDSCILDTYGCRYMATHFPEFNKHPETYKPFENSLQEIQARSIQAL
jgi:hypothetical protein